MKSNKPLKTFYEVIQSINLTDQNILTISRKIVPNSPAFNNNKPKTTYIVALLCNEQDCDICAMDSIWEQEFDTEQQAQIYFNSKR